MLIDDSTCVIAALSLNCELVPFHGMIAAIQQAIALGFKRVLIPSIDVSFLRHVNNVEIVPLRDMDALITYLRGQPSFIFDTESKIVLTDLSMPGMDETMADFSRIRGHEDAKRVLEIVAAGGHHLLLTGPPGCGKSMLSDAFHTILADLQQEEMVELYGVYHLKCVPLHGRIQPIQYN